jgi:hypothetical protein
MRISTRDRVATVVVGAAALLAIGWFADLPGLQTLDITSVTVLVLVLGLPLSAAAVIPGFAGLIGGSRIYLAISSALGVAATAAAVLTLVNHTEETLVALVGLTVVLWAASTLRHSGALTERPLQATH